MSLTRHARGGAAGAMPRRRPAKPVAVAACLILAVGLGAVGMAFGLPSSLHATLFGAVDDASPNSFSLAAYATENPEAEPGKTVEVSLGRFSPGSSMGQINLFAGEEYLASMNAAFAAEAADASQALSQPQLKLIATFTDGSTQTKTYIIAPIDGFEETYRAYLDAQYAFQKEHGTTEGFEEPKLYTITEVVEG